MFKFIVTFLKYLETIVNIFSNALIQTFLVYTTVVLIYKFYIEDQTTNYIPTFIVQTLSKIKNTFHELDFIKNRFSDSNKMDLEAKYKSASEEEAIIGQANKEHNAMIIDGALKMSFGILSVFILFAIITSRMSVNIHWYQLLLSAVITVVGTSYEYFFITQVIVKYHFIELTDIYDAMVSKVESISTEVIEGEMIEDLKEIINNHNNSNNISNSGLNNLISGNKEIVNHISSGILKELKGNNIVNQAGATMNDTEHNYLKESFTN